MSVFTYMLEYMKQALMRHGLKGFWLKLCEYFVVIPGTRADMILFRKLSQGGYLSVSIYS